MILRHRAAQPAVAADAPTWAFCEVIFGTLRLKVGIICVGAAEPRGVRPLASVACVGDQPYTCINFGVLVYLTASHPKATKVPGYSNLAWFLYLGTSLRKFLDLATWSTHLIVRPLKSELMVIMSKRQNYRIAGETFQTKSALHERIRQMLMLERLCSRFHLVARQLRSRHSHRDTLHMVCKQAQPGASADRPSRSLRSRSAGG